VPSGGCCRLLGQASGGLRGEARSEDSQSQSRLPYTYLMAWYIMHCPLVIMAVSPSEGFIPFVQRLENSSWSQYYMYYIRKAILSSSNYQLDRCFPDISGAFYGDKFADLAGLDDFKRLPFGIFWWLINIRPGNLIFRQGDSCTIEPYMPSRFARPFGYDQLYIGNSNTGLCFSGNLFEGARAWYYSVAGGTRAVFSLPHRTPNCYTSLSFYTWYFLASRVPGFKMNTSCIKSIKASYKVKSGSKSHMRGMSEY